MRLVEVFKVFGAETGTDAFLLKELELLRTSQEHELEELRRLDRWVLVAVAACWTWVLTQAPPHARWILLIGPTLVIVFLGFKDYVITRDMRVKECYLRRVEEKILGTQAFGFARFYHDEVVANGCGSPAGDERDLPAVQRKHFERLGEKRHVALPSAPFERWAVGFYVTLLLVHVSAAVFAVPLLMADEPDDRAPVVEQGNVPAVPAPAA